MARGKTMGLFHVGCRVENHVDRSRFVRVPKLFGDTGSEHTWIPGAALEKVGVVREKKDVPFVMANGQEITRSIGFAIIRIDRCFTIDEVVFAEKAIWTGTLKSFSIFSTEIAVTGSPFDTTSMSVF